MGVTAVVAARQVGPSGIVHVYEAGRDTYEKLVETVAQNGVSDVVECHHAIVGTAGTKLRSEAEDAERVGGDSLPPVDVLEIDCEGAEAGVIGVITDPPRTVIVEGHTHTLRSATAGID